MRLALLALVTLLYGPHAVAADKDWAWFIASSMINEWNLEKGTAKVRLSQDGFSADLYSGKDLVHRVVGTRKGSQVNARVTTANSGLVDMPVVGEYNKRTYKGFADTRGRETITLSRPGFVVGFTREIDK
jgi:hypothetical protein